MERIDQLIQQRNAIQLKAENSSEAEALKCWACLGVANRHIQRVIEKILPLEMVEVEILDCFRRTREQMGFGLEVQDGSHSSLLG